MIKGIEGNLSVWLRLLKAQFESLGDVFQNNYNQNGSFLCGNE